MRMRAPMLSIHTVAAGGGSVLHFDGSRYRVGPDSAGADPGPAAYRRGGPLTVTDANIMLGRIQPEYFPAVFGASGDEPVDAGIVREKFTSLARQIGEATGGNAGRRGSGADTRPARALPGPGAVRHAPPEQVAAGFLEIAVANMANAIKKISVQRGYDITRYVLATFGGAGGQHACAVADALGITEVLIHPLAGVLSAYGMGLADVTAMRERSVEAPLTAGLLPELDRVADAPRRRRARGPRDGRRRARRACAGAPGPPALRGHRHRAAGPAGPAARDAGRLRAGVPAVLLLPHARQGDHRRGRVGRAGRRLRAAGRTGSGRRARGAGRPGSRSGPEQARAGAIRRRCTRPVGGRRARLARRRDLRPGQRVAGPALIVEDFATTVVEPGWRAELTGRGDLLLTRVEARPDRVGAGTAVDPVMLEIFNNLFMSVAEQMGVRLQATAHSVNVKERLDFSCAMFDADGGLIANAPHMPVHLGSMGESIKIVARRNAGRMRPGDVYVLNDPYHGGTHLPDVTVVTPVFGRAGRILFYVASRGHHAEIGGITPGSMPAFSTRIEEEGVLIDNWLLVRDGELREAATLDLLRSAVHPSRNPGRQLADLRAQIAANEKGVAELGRMVSHFGLDVVQAYMGHVQDNAEEAVRRVIGGAARRRVHLRARQRVRDQGRGAGGPGGADRRRSTSPAPRRSCPTTSTRRPRWRWPRCCTCCGRWWPTTSRSTRAA